MYRVYHNLWYFTSEVKINTTMKYKHVSYLISFQSYIKYNSVFSTTYFHNLCNPYNLQIKFHTL